MAGLRMTQVAASCCALVLAVAVIATAAEAPARLLIGLLQVLVVVALVAPHVAILSVLRRNASPARMAWGLLLVRATGWTTLLLAGLLLYLSWHGAQRTGPQKGFAEVSMATLALIPPVIVLLVGGRRMAAVHAGRKLPLARAAPVAVAAGASIIALPSVLLWQAGWQHTWLAESGAIGDMRTMISAQWAYAQATGGGFGTPECLVAPRECMKGYDGPVFLDETFLPLVRNGYVRIFYAGPSLDARAATTILRSYAYVAMPEEAGVTGGRGFCGDDTGVIRAIPGTRLPIVVDGRCPPGEPLR